jgi:ABC-2 type transport system ATP-binding protein
MNALEIKDLRKSFRQDEVLHGINLTIPKGEFFGLLGQNGAGKSTTINCITGIGTFTEGSISVFGNDVQRDYQITRAAIGLSPQEFNMDFFAPVEKTLDYVGGYFGLKKPERQARIEYVLNQFELQDHRKKSFNQLSGGLKRRATLARALIHDPDLIILDEPTAGIDVEQRHRLWEDLKQLHKDGKTIILTSHYLEEVQMLCSRVAILHKGVIHHEVDTSEMNEAGELERIYLDLTKA